MSVSESREQYTRKSTARSTVSAQLRSAPVFVLCEGCYWSATFLDKYTLRKKEEVDDDDKKCPRCDAVDSLSSIPIMTNESFTFNYTEKRGIELEFNKRT
jgi:hypothetical protein